MVKMKKNFGKICLAAVIIAFSTPLTSIGSQEGHDWYCSDKEAHSKYEAHFKKHLDHSAEAITEKLSEIFSDSKLTTDEKKAMTVDLLNKHLAKMNLGTGD